MMGGNAVTRPLAAYEPNGEAARDFVGLVDAGVRLQRKSRAG